MAELLKQGLEISAYGLGLTFAALGMLILMMMLLERLFRPKQAAIDEWAPKSDGGGAGDGDEEEIAAAIGVALVYWRSQASRQGELGRRLEAGRGGWWSGARSVPTGNSSRKRRDIGRA